MTDHDRKLIEKAKATSRWHYRDIDPMIDGADTPEAREILCEIRWELRDLMLESL